MSLSLTPLELVWCPHATDTEQVWRVRIISGRWGFIFHLFSTQKNYSNMSPSEWQHNPLMHSWASYQVPSPELCNGWKIAGEGMSCSLGSLSASQFSQRSAWRYWPHCGHRCRLCAELRLLQHPGNADSLVWCSKLDPFDSPFRWELSRAPFHLLVVAESPSMLHAEHCWRGAATAGDALLLCHVLGGACHLTVTQ